MTEYLIERKLWTPPNTKTPFDILPLVFKVPGRAKPYVYQLPKESVHEVNIEHPRLSAITQLGYKWVTVPVICNFKMNLGGVLYQNCPFNGWFMSTEIVRNLMERYDAAPECARALKIDTATNPMYRQLVSCEVRQMHDTLSGSVSLTFLVIDTA